MSASALGVNGIDFIVAPRAICLSCGSRSGPRYPLSPLPGPSAFHRNNSFPDATSLNVALSTISDIESQIFHLDTEIISLQNTLSVLQHRRDFLEQYKTQQQSLFFPIRKLPQDLLLHLFLECQQFLDDGYFTIGKRSCLRTITQVCAYWRSLAFEFPLLWNRLRIRDCAYDAPKEYTLTTAHLIEECLHLSKEAPLSIQFEGVVAGKFTPLLDPCVRAIARNAYRWDHITVDNSRIFEAAMEYITADSSLSLRSLDISGISRSISIPPTPYLTHLTVGKLRGVDSQISFQSASSLTHLSLHGILHPLSFLLNLPWDRITHFTCRISEDISPIIDLMLELKSLEMIGHTKISESAALPHLKELTINSYMTLGNALDVWTTPDLQVLHLEESVDFTTVVSFLRRSRCILRELTYTHSIAPIGDGLRAEELQQLKKLTLRQHTIDEFLLLRSEHAVLPNLETLNLCYTNHTGDVPTKDLIEIVQIVSPSESFHVLRSIDILLPWDLTNEETDTLRSFFGLDIVRHAGVEVRIRHGYMEDTRIELLD